MTERKEESPVDRGDYVSVAGGDDTRRTHKNYEETTDKWRNVRELIRKSCIYDADAGLGGGVYHWKSVAAADEWHGAAWRQLVRDLYGSDSVVRRFEWMTFFRSLLGEVKRRSVDFLSDRVV